MSKTVKDLETYATLLQSSIYDLYKAQKINNPLNKFCLYGVRKNTIKVNHQSLLFNFISQIKQNQNSIYPPLIELIQSSSTYYLCFDSFNLMLDVTLSKGYKDNYLYNITKRKQYIDDMRKIAAYCDRQLSPVNLIMDDHHVYCLPPYNSPKGNYQQNNKNLMIKLIYSLITGDKLYEDQTKISENGKNLVKLLQINYNNPHLDSIIHENLERDEQQIQFNNFGVNNNLKNLAKDLDFRRSQNIDTNKSSGYDMNFDDWTPDMLLDDDKVYKPTVSGRISTIINDDNYPSIDDYQPFQKPITKNDQYPDFLQKQTNNKKPNYKSNYPQFTTNQNTNNYQYQNQNQSNYPTINPVQQTFTNPQLHSYPTNFGVQQSPVIINHKNNQYQQNIQSKQNTQTITNQSQNQQNNIQQKIQNTAMHSQYPQFQQDKINQNKYNNYPPLQPKVHQTKTTNVGWNPNQQVQSPKQHNIPQNIPKSIPQNIPQNKIDTPVIKMPQIQTNPNQINKPYIPSRPPIQSRLTKNPKKDQINHILSSVTGFMSNMKPRQKTSIKKIQSFQSLFKPQDNSPNKLFEFALQNYLGQFKLYSRLIKSFLAYYITTNLGRVASFLLARSCVHRKLRLINDLINGKDIFDLGDKVLKQVDVGKYVQKIEKTVYKQDPEQFKLLINFKSITPQTFTLLKPYLGEIDEMDKTQDLCFYYLYTLSIRDPKKDYHHLMLYDALYVLHYRGYQFLYDYKQLPKQYDETYAEDKRQLIQLFVIR